MKDELRGPTPPDKFAHQYWPKDFEYKKPGHSGYFKSIAPKTTPTSSGESEKKTWFLDDLEDISRDVAEIVYRKHLDYGPGGILDAPYGPIQGVITRLHDKIARAINLTKYQDASPENESLRDTFIDIVGYGLIAITLLDDKFPKK